MSDLQYWLAFNRIPGIGKARFALMERSFGVLEAAWRARPQELKAAGLDERSVNAILSARAQVDPQAELERLLEAGVDALTWTDTRYPPRLKEIPDPPPVLYIKGSLLPEDERSVAVVGTRGATAYGREAASYISGDLAKNGVTVVSGLARGIDAIAHRAALQAGGRTIAVLGCGVDVIYPREHADLARSVQEHGAVVSEHPLGTQPEAKNFPRRNRILSGMTLGTLVIEAGEVSGAMWTVRHALEQDREVFCVPGSIFSQASLGTNLLIQQGAKLVLSYTDVLEELNLSSVAHQSEMPGLLRPADDNEARVLKQVTLDPVHVDEITRGCGLSIATVSGTLAVMELKGLVRQVGGMNYVRVRDAVAEYKV